MASNLIFRQFDEDAERTAATRGWSLRACGSGRYACPWVFFFLFVSYFIYRGGHLNYLGKSLIYCDLSFEAVAKITLVNVFCPPRLIFL
jgi:hypothetical protein